MSIEWSVKLDRERFTAGHLVAASRRVMNEMMMRNDLDLEVYEYGDYCRTLRNGEMPKSVDRAMLDMRYDAASPMASLAHSEIVDEAGLLKRGRMVSAYEIMQTLALKTGAIDIESAAARVLEATALRR